MNKKEIEDLRNQNNEKKERRKTRSDSYQYLLLESSFSHDMMESFANSDSIYSKLNPFEYSEELLDLQDQLKEEFWRLVDTLLTDRQKTVLTLYSTGMTQMEIADELNINQSSITKSLWGNVDYSSDVSHTDDSSKNKTKRRVYGGSARKIRKLIESDEKIKEILRKMNEYRNEKW